mgnify:CR=1 FL=1
MSRPIKQQEFLHCRLDKSLAEQVNLYAAETKRTKTAVVELALSKYFADMMSTSPALQAYKKREK